MSEEVQVESVEQHCATLRLRCRELEAELQRLRAAARPRAVEKYYSVAEVSVLLGFAERWVRDRIRDGRFAGVVDLGGHVRIPASSVNAYLEANPMFWEAGVPARSVGELRRKAGRFMAADE